MKEIKTEQYKEAQEGRESFLTRYPKAYLDMGVNLGKAVGRGAYETFGGYKPSIGDASTAIKDKIMKIYQMIGSDPAIVNAVPRLGTAMKDMSTFVAQQQATAKQQEESIAMARYRRQKMEEGVASGKKQVMGVPMGQQAQPPLIQQSEGNRMHDQMNAIKQQNQG